MPLIASQYRLNCPGVTAWREGGIKVTLSALSLITSNFKLEEEAQEKEETKTISQEKGETFLTTSTE